MAGFGVKLWAIVQMSASSNSIIKKSWETFFANAGVITGFGVIDQESQNALSKKLGALRMTTQVPTGSVGSELQRGAASMKDERFDVPLLAEDELGRVFDREEKRVLDPGRRASARHCRAA